MNSPRLRILVRLSWQVLRLRLKAHINTQQRINRLLFETFKDLGGIYVKFLQILVLDHEFTKGWSNAEKQFGVFETVPFEDIDMPALLKAEMPDYEKHFLTIDLKPFAAGSFAQVYKGVLRDNTQVVLKVLRPSLVKNLTYDLRLIGWIVRLTGMMNRLGAVDMKEFYRQFRATVHYETDYRREVKNAEWFYDYFADKPDVVVPKTYAKLSGEHIIVQEMVGGISLAEVLQAQDHGEEVSLYVYDRTGSNVWTQMETFGTELLIGITTADFVIGDPHPGNVKLLPGNKIGLIDFGIAAAAPANRKGFLGILKEYEKIYAGDFDAGTFTVAALEFFDEELTQALNVAGRVLTPWEPRMLIQKIGDAARKALDDALSSPRASSLLDDKIMLKLFNESINEKNRFGLAINLDAADMLKSAGTCINVIRRVGTYEQNFPVVYNGLRRAISYAEGNLPEVEPTPEPRPEYALEFLSSWLAGIADSDPFLYRQITGTIGS